MVRYPHIHLTLRTANPLVLVAAVREEMRRAGVDRSEIRRFSDEALAGGELDRARRVCARWVSTTRSREPRRP